MSCASKGGDPFLFGRGGEECAALREAGIRYEVVPGISSALAAPAYAGIPLTHRALSASVTILTGAHARPAPTEQTRETARLAGAADTLVILMGAAHLREIADELIAAGRCGSTPAAVIHWGTYEGQQTVTGTLQTIPDKAERAGVGAPSVIVVGEVVSLRERLRWFETSTADAVCEELELVAAEV